MIHSFHFLFLKYRSMAGKSEHWEAFCEFRGKLHKYKNCQCFYIFWCYPAFTSRGEKRLLTTTRWWESLHLTVSHKSSSCREVPDTRPSPHCSSVSNPAILHQLSVTKLHTHPRTQIWNSSHPRKYHQIMVHEGRSSPRSFLRPVWEQILTTGGNVNLYSV